MMTLFMKEHGFEAIGFYVIDSFKLDDLIKLSFPRWKHGEFATAMESGNDTDHQITVSGKLDDYDKKDLEKYESGEDSWCGTPQLLMDSMCATGKLAAGNYLVEVCW